MIDPVIAIDGVTKHDGRLALVSAVDEIRTLAPRRITVQFRADVQAAETTLPAGVGVVDIQPSLRRRGAAAAGAGLAALGLYLFDVVARVWRPAGPFAWISPFHYYDPLDLIQGRALALSHLWVLVGVGVAGAATAYFVYSRRDL